ncbi:hypothetical protein BGZ50_009125 [Haplosporangium sp. Z 11]|nr:hypothetical protein BGZ50_009125 [Haplosporangium sp. Z 11]
MASLLFQPSKEGSSSSSSANPFQALAHFYEQELTDVQIDSRLSSSSSSSSSKQYRQRSLGGVSKQSTRTQHHLFPSSSSSSSSSSSPYNQLLSSPPLSHGSYTYKDKDHHYAHSQVQDEFQRFTSASATATNPSANWHSAVHGSGNADIAEYLKQRQEYYAREAQVRSQDRHDGLGPILDFSEVGHEHHMLHSHFHPHVQNGAVHGKVIVGPGARRELGDHHHDHQRKATSQQEQVWMDLTHKSHESDSLESAWKQEAELVWGQSHGAMTSTAPRTRSITSDGSLLSSFRNAAASVPSAWPLAPWAIETEAALLEFGTLYKDYGGQQHHIQNMSIPLQQTESLEYNPTTDDWSAEFSQASSTYSPSLLPNNNTGSVDTMDHTIQVQERRSSVKTCGFMFDAKRSHGDGIDIDLDRLADQMGLLSSTPITASSSLDQDTSLQRTQVSIDNMLVSAQQPTVTSTPSTIPAAMEPIIVPQSQVLTNTSQEVYNDDVFEGDMLQAWMETLAQEKQEADEKRAMDEAEATEKLKQQEEAASNDAIIDGNTQQDKAVLDVALRRLNALMRQLDQRQSPNGNTISVAEKLMAASTMIPPYSSPSSN